MNKNLKLILLGILFIALIAGATVLYDYLGSSAAPEQLATEPPAPTGDTGPSDEASDPQRTAAPDFTVVDMDGNQRKLSEFVGKPIILNFWASWCGPCKMEMPDFDEAYQQYGNSIHFLMVNCTTSSRETMDRAKALIADEGFSFPVYFDTTGEASGIYGAYSIPLTYFIDAEGYLEAYASGAIDRETLQIGIDRIYTPQAE